MVTTPNFFEACAPILADLNKQPSARRIKTAARLMEELQLVMADLAEARRSGVRELRAEGWTLQRVATELGMSISRVKQIEDPTYDTRPKGRTPTGGKPGRPPKPPVDQDAAIREALEAAGR